MEKITRIIADSQAWLAGLETWLGALVILLVTLALWGLIAWLLVPWYILERHDIAMAKKARSGDVKKMKQTTKMTIALVVMWLLSTLALFLWINWTPGPTVATQEEPDVWLSWKWRAIITLVSCVLGAFAILKTWTIRFFQDGRIAIGSHRTLPTQYWPWVSSAAGFFSCLVIGAWFPNWYLVPIALIFWRLGSLMAPTEHERWVPRVNNGPFCYGEDHDWFYYGNSTDLVKKEECGKSLYFFMLLIGVPVWLPLYTILVSPYYPKDHPGVTLQVPLKGGSTAAFPFTIKLQIGANVRRFQILPPSEKETLLTDCVDIAIRHITNLVTDMSPEVARDMADKKFQDSDIKTKIETEWLKSKGCGAYSEDVLDFGATIMNQKEAEAQNDLRQLELDAQKATLEQTAQDIRNVTREKALQVEFMAKARGLIDTAKAKGENLSLAAAWEMVIEMNRSTSPRVEIRGGTPSFNMPLPGTNP